MWNTGWRSQRILRREDDHIRFSKNKKQLWNRPKFLNSFIEIHEFKVDIIESMIKKKCFSFPEAKIKQKLYMYKYIKTLFMLVKSVLQ